MGGPTNWRDFIAPWSPPKATVGTWGFNSPAASAYLNGARNNNPAAQNDSIDWDVVLSAGTWNVSLLYAKTTGSGIVTVQLDDGAGAFTALGTVDAYAAATAWNNQSTITGFTVAAGIRRTLRLLMATKNASSTGYQINLQSIDFRRTA